MRTEKARSGDVAAVSRQSDAGYRRGSTSATADPRMHDGIELRELDVAIFDVRAVLIAQHQVVLPCALDDVESARA